MGGFSDRDDLHDDDIGVPEFAAKRSKESFPSGAQQ
jgi:hypothetical protein